MNGRDEIEMLLSRRNDPDLTQAEHTTIDEIVRNDAALAQAGRSYDRLNQFLAAWRPVPASIDWAARGAAISGRIGEEHELASTDQLLRDSLAAMPAVDWSASKARFSQAVRAAAATEESARTDVGRARKLRWFARATPFAAAAALVFAAMWWTNPATVVPPEVATSIVQVAMAMPSGGGQVNVSFDRSQTIDDEAEVPVGGRAIAFGPRRAETGMAVDDADLVFFY